MILTGMGRDGAAPLAALRTGGARTIGQSSETCVVDGMPRAARDLGAVEDSVPLDEIGAAILERCAKGPRA